MLQQLLKHKGFDISKEFCIGKYNEFFASYDPSFVLPTSWSKFHDKSLALIVGNTKQIWPHFVNECDKTVENPFDKYVMDAVNEALCDQTLPHKVYFSHQKNNRSNQLKPIIAIQHAAHIARLAYYDNKNSFLSIHHEYGPWFALRCVIVFEQEYNGAEEPPLENPCSESVQLAIYRALQEAINGRGDWTKWVAMRDECNVNNSSKWRYGPNQMGYHYTLDKKYVKDEPS
jgi:methylmalonic aciduria homocystinuria type C protein